MDIFLPVYESAIVLAGYYANKCGRTTVTPRDVQYGFRYSARNVTGKQLGSLYPEVYEDEESSDEEEESSDEEVEFTRYIGDDDMCLKMNECYDTWESWEPETPAEQALKKSIDKVDAKE